MGVAMLDLMYVAIAAAGLLGLWAIVNLFDRV
jgi:hypothetical protein